MKPWSCDPARIARWRAIDRERARRSARDASTRVEPTEAPPVPVEPVRERYTVKPGVAGECVARTPAMSILRGVKSL